ncbi:MAG: glycine zipper 2TM domain-containing protein [Pseudomonadota bacterium]
MLSRKLNAAILLAAVGIIGTSSVAYANDQGVNTLLGAAVGAAIGHGISGRDGAIVGGVLGATVGASASTYDRYDGGPRYYGPAPATTYYSAPRTTYYSAPTTTYYSEPETVYYSAPAPVYYSRPPVYVQPAPVYYGSAPVVIEGRYYRGDRDYYRHHGYEGRRYDDRGDHWRR